MGEHRRLIGIISLRSFLTDSFEIIKKNRIGGEEKKKKEEENEEKQEEEKQTTPCEFHLEPEKQTSS